MVNNMKKVFIDGSQGTTGLKIFDRLKKRDDIELLTLPDELRKDIKSRKEALNSADIAFLCLPDAAAIEAAELVTNDDTVIIDTSTAHRTSDGWAYGFPEIFKDGFKTVASSKRIASPGCYGKRIYSACKASFGRGYCFSGPRIYLSRRFGLQRSRQKRYRYV